jgi:hypothetical protein
MNQLNVLMIKDGDSWTAQCLQYDIAGQGSTIKEAQSAFEYALVVEVGYAAQNGRTLDDLPTAPQCYWKKYAEASKMEPATPEPLRVPSDVANLARALIPAQREHRVF